MTSFPSFLIPSNSIISLGIVAEKLLPTFLNFTLKFFCFNLLNFKYSLASNGWEQRDPKINIAVFDGTVKLMMSPSYYYNRFAEEALRNYFIGCLSK